MKLTRSSEVEWVDGIQKGAYSQRRKKLSAEGIGSSVWELAPGKKSFPFHKHTTTEEALYVISGKAKVRSSSGLTDIGPGDFIAFPPNEDAHQLVNDGTEPLVYLAMSVSKGLDVTTYPDSKKAHTTVDGKGITFQQSSAVGFFDGEPDAG